MTQDIAAPLQNIIQKRILLINDLSCFGKCSLTVSLPTFAVCGIEAVPLPTALLSTHTGGFPVPYILPLGEHMEGIARNWRELGLTFDAIYSGYLCGEDQISLTEQIFDTFADAETLCVVDPVMGDGGKLYHGFDLSFARRMRRLCERADIITPNATEAALLCGFEPACMTDPDIRAQVVERMRGLCEKTVITGVVENDGTVGYLFADQNGVNRDIRHAHYDRPLHGCGDVFASALCCATLRGRDFDAAVRTAAEFTLRCISETVPAAPYHWYGLRYEAGLSWLAQQFSQEV